MGFHSFTGCVTITNRFRKYGKRLLGGNLYEDGPCCVTIVESYDLSRMELYEIKYIVMCRYKNWILRNIFYSYISENLLGGLTKKKKNQRIKLFSNWSPIISPHRLMFGGDGPSFNRSVYHRWLSDGYRNRDYVFLGEKCTRSVFRRRDFATQKKSGISRSKVRYVSDAKRDRFELIAPNRKSF